MSTNTEILGLWGQELRSRLLALGTEPLLSPHILLPLSLHSSSRENSGHDSVSHDSKSEDDNDRMINCYRSYQCQQAAVRNLLTSAQDEPRAPLSLFEQQHVEKLLQRPWVRLELSLQINRLLFYLQSLELTPSRYQELRQQFLERLFQRQLGAEKVVYCHGKIVSLTDMAALADTPTMMPPVATVPESLSGGKKKINLIRRG